jgi:hypothetical protein
VGEDEAHQLWHHLFHRPFFSSAVLGLDQPEVQKNKAKLDAGN